ncbi:uncharacterized protein LOC115879331 [Sitophilus oryzae]|uniref:Uncharacterized protein LOC115879331 n=1 Tax=Sitophilus oryzae TaxID=7048 RepID=A0A6J2XM60_SITOR|nr:uncharacterized protein LOC115879331 [Sitophilus oryzae]
MPTKSFLVKAELTIHKLSCPGVWLCSNGKISLQLGMLDSNIQTEAYKPIFPMLFDEKFIFYKTFLKERRLGELQRSLYREKFLVEMIQWKNCDEGVVLANYKTSLDELLYPSSFRKTELTGNNVDVLMEPTKLFPGTIAPKLQLKTKTTIEETYSEVNPKIFPKPTMGHHQKYHCNGQISARKLHPKKVCHTVGYSKALQRCPKTNKDKRPIFMYRRPEDDLILRTNPNKVIKDDMIMTNRDLKSLRKKKENVCMYQCSENGDTCYCNKSVPMSQEPSTKTSFVKTVQPNKIRRSSQTYPCDSQYESCLCTICEKYECTFFEKNNLQKDMVSESTQEDDNLCPHCREYSSRNYQCYESDNASEKKVCFCLPKKKTAKLARKLQNKIRNTVQNGASSLENCLRDCEVSD